MQTQFRIQESIKDLNWNLVPKLGYYDRSKFNSIAPIFDLRKPEISAETKGFFFVHNIFDFFKIQLAKLLHTFLKANPSENVTAYKKIVSRRTDQNSYDISGMTSEEILLLFQ